MRGNKISLLLIALLVSGLTFFSLKTTNAEIVESVPHRDHGANGLEGQENPDPPDTTVGDIFPPFQVDAGSAITGINYKFNSTQDLVDAFSGGAKKYSAPNVTINLTNSNLQPGEVTYLVAQPSNFDALFTYQYFAWCLGTKEKRIAQNGLVAGGTRIPQEGNGSDCYDPVQRNPLADNDTDINNDGMGDQWEIRYFGTTQVQPDADNDNDGFLMNTGNGISGPRGLIKLVPNVLVNGKTYVTSDGKFTNAEEWVWGTNPTDPDTDDDGFGDEEDVSGKGQIDFNYSPPDGTKTGDSEFLEVIADGYASYREDNGETKLAKIANTGRTLYVGNGGTLQGSLEYQVINDTTQDPVTFENLSSAPEDMYVNDIVELHANVDGSKSDELNLHYQWSFKLLDGGVDYPDDPNKVLDTVGPLPSEYAIPDSQIGRNGFGMNPYRLKIGQMDPTETMTGFHIQPKTGNKIIAEVLVTEPESGKQVDIVQPFPIATSVALEFSPELPIQPLYPQADISSAPTYTVTATVPGLNTRDFLYEWFIDEVKQPNASIGGNTLNFKATKQSGSYKISVVLTKVADEKIFAQAIANAVVSPLRVSINNCPDFENKNNLTTNTPITLKASIIAQGVFPGKLSYQWSLNDKPITDASEKEIPSITFVPRSVGAYNVTYKAESVPPTQATAEPYVPLVIYDTCRISVTNTGSLTSADRLTRLYASVVSVFPKMLQGVLTFFGIIFVIFAIIVIVRNQHKKTL